MLRVRLGRESREFLVVRTLLVVVAAPTGVLLAGAAVASEGGGRWGLWLSGAVLWLLISGGVTAAVWWRMVSGGRW
jgi:hypothetical protein